MLVLITSSVSAQWSLDVVGTVKKEENNKRFEGATITIKKNGAVWKTLTSDVSGKFEASLEPDAVYLLEFSKPGHITKRIEFSTKGVPPDDAKYGFEFPMEMNLFEKQEGLDVSILNKPIAKVAFNPSTGYMDYDPEYTKSIKNELDRLKLELAERLKAQEAERKAKQVNYDKAILAADKLYNTQKFQDAKPLYEEAAKVFPDETYPKTQLSEITKKLAEIEESNKQYNAAIAAADKSFGEKKWDVALTNYQKAISLKPTEKYPADKIKEVNTLSSNDKKNAEAYKAAIAAADQLFGANDYAKSKIEYQKALTLKPAEEYPKSKIVAIDKLLADSQQKEQDYKAAIAEADNFFNTKEYEKSKVSYNKALAIKPAEAYPKTKIAEVDKFLGDQKKIQEDYARAIAEGDKMMAAKDYKNAQVNYQQASTLKSSEKYPKDKLAEIKSILDNLASKDADAKQKDAAYLAAITSGDKSMGLKKYEEAKQSYQTAIGIKSAEKYPKDKIAEIETILADLAKKKAAEESSMLADKEKTEKYNTFIAAADKSFTSKNYVDAKSNYNQAIGIKSTEKYPKDKLLEIDKILADLAAKKALEDKASATEKEINDRYNKLIASADNDFSTTNYQNAKTKYTDASALKKDEQYPKDKIIEINKLLADLAKKSDDDKLAAEANRKKREYYAAVIAQADGEYLAKKYEEAKVKYNEASTIIPEEKYPKTKIQEIDALLARLAADKENASLAEKTVNEKYNALIASADGYFNSKDYVNAKLNYKQALNVKANETYPKGRIAEIDNLLAELTKKAEEEKLANNALKQKNDKYNSLIKQADASFDKKAYRDAINLLNEASNLEPSETYPPQKIAEITALMDELDRKDKDSKAQLQAEKQKKEKYNKLIYDGDRAFRFKKLTDAKSNYEQAIGLYANEKYPKEQLAEIEKLNNQANETIVVNNDPTGPRVKITDAKEKELEAMIAESLKNREADKGAAIDKYKAEIGSQEEIRISSSYDKRKSAQNDLENLSADLKTKYEEADKMHAENFEKMKEETAQQEAAQKDLISNSESKRQAAQAELKQTEENIKLFNNSQDKQLQEKVQELYAFADGVIEYNAVLQENANAKRAQNASDINQLAVKIKDDIDLAESRRKARELVVADYAKQLADQEADLIAKSKSKRQYNQDSLVAMVKEIHQKQLDATKFFELNAATIASYKQTIEILERARIDFATNKRHEKLREVENYQSEINVSAKKQADNYISKTAYLQGYKDDLAAIEKERVDKHSENNQAVKLQIEKIAEDKKALEKSNAESYLRFYEKLENDRSRNTQFLADMTELSYQKIRNVKPNEVYTGELKPSENLELANKYPQGITEESAEEGNAIILKRIKVTGKHVDVYQKIFYKWGGTFYTKNGYNITETLWKLESIEE